MVLCLDGAVDEFKDDARLAAQHNRCSISVSALAKLYFLEVAVQFRPSFHRYYNNGDPTPELFFAFDEHGVDGWRGEIRSYIVKGVSSRFSPFRSRSGEEMSTSFFRSRSRYSDTMSW